MTGRQLARLLQNKHEYRSWRKISQEDYFGLVPATTLCKIAKTKGEYLPIKWRPVLGLGHARSTCQLVKHIADMSARELTFAFANRVEMA
jgi:hypothetical protein